MFIKLTNCHKDRLGDPILINANSILSVYEDHEEGGSLKTIIYSTTGMVWYIEESVETVYKLIQEALRK